MQTLLPYMNILVPMLFIIVAATVGGGLWAAHRKAMRPWKELASTFESGNAHCGVSSRDLTGIYRGYTFSAKTADGDLPRLARLPYAPPHFKITLNKPTKLRLTIHRRSASFSGDWREALETLGIMKVFPTGDPALDQGFALSSSEEDGALRPFLGAETNTAFGDILSMGFDGVMFDGRNVTAYMNKYPIAEIDLVHTRIAAILDGLILISSRAG